MNTILALIGNAIRNRLLIFSVHTALALQVINPAPSAAADGDNKYLDMGLAQLMQITVTSVAKKPQTLADTAAAVFVISQEDIRRSGVTSIPEALAMAPGLQVARISASKWSIAARGFGGYTSNKLLVLIDGRSVYTPAYSGTFWDMQNTMLEDIDRIEVIRGPGGTLWGANAVNGVINIITRKSQETLGTLVRTGFGNEEKVTAGARYGGTIGDSAFGRIYVTGNDRGSNVLAGSGEDAYDSWDTLQAGFRTDGIVGSQNEWTFQGDVYENDGDQIVYPLWLDGPPYLAIDYGDYTASGGNLTGSWRHRFDGGDVLTFKSYFDENDRTESYYAQNFTTLDFDLQYETALGDRNNLTLGTGYRHVDGEFERTFQVWIPDQTSELYSAFLQDEINLLRDRLWLTVGSKFEHNDFTGDEWQPSARMLWKPGVDHSVWAAVGRAVRTPTMIERTGSVLVAAFPTSYGTGTASLVSNPEFDSEVLIAYETGYRWQVESNFSVDAAIYYNDYDEIYSTVPTGNPYSYDQMFDNVVEGTGKGLELSANWRVNPWLSLIGTYTWQDLDLSETPDYQGQPPTPNISSINHPSHQASLRSAIDITEDWQLNGWLRYVDEILARSSENFYARRMIPVPSYFLLDANLVWKPRKNLEIMLAGRNLLNNSQLEYIAELITPATEIERSVYCKVTWNF